ncbi:MAG: KamA family radical SAM protein [Thermoguttaceae bacterium]
MGNWYNNIESAVRDPLELGRILEMPDCSQHSGCSVHVKKVCEKYPLLVPRPFLQKMEKGNPNDPLFLQIMPQERELLEVDGFVTDPLEESNPTVQSNFLSKYAGRTLLLTTSQCAIHCRYCFRRHHIQRNSEQSSLSWADELLLLRTPEIILSGGDPLMLDDVELEQLFGQIKRNPAIRRIRIHTRLPVLIPNRITPSLLGLLRSDRHIANYLVLHLNHPREMDNEFEASISQLVDQGTPVLVQSVLLRGVNDSLPVLLELYERLISLRLIPYYLHQLDRVAGAAHFEVATEKGLLLYEQLQRHLPGYAVPKYVRELPGYDHKVVLSRQ